MNAGSSSFFLPTAINLNGKALTLDVESATLAQVQAVISGAGSLITTGQSSALFYASNTFSGPVQVLEGALSIYNGHALGDTNGNTTISSGAALIILNAVSVPEPIVLAGTLSSAGAGAKTLNAPVTLTDPNATIEVQTGAPLTINGVISGTGGFTKTQGDLLILNSNNTYSGTTTVDGGELQVNGAQPVSPIVLDFDSLSGTGTVGTITTTDSGPTTVAPGGNAPGILTCSNLTLDSQAIFAVRLNGPASGTGYDQLKVNGTVSLNNAELQGSVGYNPAVGQSFVIINNDGVDPVNGTFNGLTNGALVGLDGYPFQINYAGGTGNDVVLTRISPPTYLTSIKLTNGTASLTATGALESFSYTLFAATNLTSGMVWSNLGSVSASSGGLIGFMDNQAGLFSRRFYRIASP
jgi:autotransporter-associated beta strand protein